MGTGGASRPRAAAAPGLGAAAACFGRGCSSRSPQQSCRRSQLRELAAAAAPHPPIHQRPLVPLFCWGCEYLFLFNYSFKKPHLAALSPARRVTNSHPEPPEVAEVAALPDLACSHGRGIARERTAHVLRQHTASVICSHVKSPRAAFTCRSAVLFVPPRRAAVARQLAGTGCPNSPHLHIVGRCLTGKAEVVRPWSRAAQAELRGSGR